MMSSVCAKFYYLVIHKINFFEIFLLESFHISLNHIAL